uniref:AIPP2-like SPOC-like domain-containing protein n=1 Tax=Daucus carota subsp. sativus TaxID=79200 RepID=A0A162AIE1_DAUCS
METRLLMAKTLAFVFSYCLDVIPNTLDEIVTWYCEDCQEDLTPSTKEAHGSGSMNIRDTNSTDTEDHMFEDGSSHGVHSAHNDNHSRNSVENEQESRLLPYGYDCVQEHVIRSSSRNGAFEEARGSGFTNTEEQIFEDDPSHGVPSGHNHNHSSISMECEEESCLAPYGHDCMQDPVIHSSSRDGAFEEARGSGSTNIRDTDSTDTEEQIFEDGTYHGIHSGHNHHHHSSNSMDNKDESLLVSYGHNCVQDNLVHSSVSNGAFERLQMSSEYDVNPRLICNTAHNSDVSEISYLGNPTPLVQDHHIPAQPVKDPIWRGAFVIINKKRGTYDGVVAHISNKACSKVCEKARSLENFLHFEKHPKSDVWPKSFQNSLPSDESIALYFLPADRSGEEVFENLVDYMIGDEIALKATIEDAELLVFSSTELPLSYWRFQGKYYLWGVFRGKRAA